MEDGLRDGPAPWVCGPPNDIERLLGRVGWKHNWRVGQGCSSLRRKHIYTRRRMEFLPSNLASFEQGKVTEIRVQPQQGAVLMHLLVGQDTRRFLQVLQFSQVQVDSVLRHPPAKSCNKFWVVLGLGRAQVCPPIQAKKTCVVIWASHGETTVCFCTGGCPTWV